MIKFVKKIDIIFVDVRRPTIFDVIFVDVRQARC